VWGFNEVPRDLSSSASSPTLRFQLELLHNWETSTALTMGKHDKSLTQKIWRVTVPGFAQSHPFLLHSILAFSAAHMAWQNPARRTEMTSIARYHHGLASALFRRYSVLGVGRSNSAVSLAFCVLAMLTALSLLPPSGDSEEDIDSFLGWAMFLRQSMRFAWSFDSASRNDSRICGLIAHLTQRRQLIPTLDSGLEKSLDGLQSASFLSSEASLLSKRVFSLAVMQTKQWFHLVPIRPSGLNFTVHWFIMIPDEYVEMVKEKKPLALALLCHWLVPLYHVPREWFLGDWPERIVAAIAKRLGPSRELVKWVLEEVDISSLS
jgi:hypothetical protein